jgi:hypothetical protein
MMLHVHVADSKDVEANAFRGAVVTPYDRLDRRNRREIQG